MDNVEKYKNTEIKENDILAQYIKELKEDTTLTQFNLKEKALMCSSIWSKWLSYLYKEKENLSRISDTKQKILHNKISNNNANNTSVLRLKSEDKLAENDETLKKLNDLYKKTQTNIDFIERALNILQNFTFSIKNSIEILKLNFEH